MFLHIKDNNNSLIRFLIVKHNKTQNITHREVIILGYMILYYFDSYDLFYVKWKNNKNF